MITFLIKGLIRDRSRFLFPIIVVTLGVMITVLLHGWIGGVMMDLVRSTANFSTGHVRIITKAYAENEDQFPNDLALIGVDSILSDLRQKYPQMNWVRRIRFGGLLDIPDAQRETRAQGPTAGLAVDLLSPNSPNEKSRLNFEKALVRGRMLTRSGEILISDEFALKLGVLPGNKATLLSSTMNGSMAMQNFIIAGTLRFGLPPMDKAAMIMDVTDAQTALDMTDAASELLGYFNNGVYDVSAATTVAAEFNAAHEKPTDEFAPIMKTLRQHYGLAEYLDMATSASGIMVAIFMVAMSIVLWNAGLLGGLRRYGEVGLRLAIGEYKGHIYRSMIIESICIGFAGSVMGTLIGLSIVYYIHVHGVDVSSFFQNSNLMISTVVYTRITFQTFYLGFIPGLFATMLGTMLAGIGIYRRQTSHLFKELEA